MDFVCVCVASLSGHASASLNVFFAIDPREEGGSLSPFSALISIQFWGRREETETEGKKWWKDWEI